MLGHGMKRMRAVGMQLSKSTTSAVGSLRKVSRLGFPPSGLTVPRSLAAAVPALPSPFSPSRLVSRSIFIKVESTPNPDSMKFLPENFVVLPEKFGNGVHFSDIGQAKGSKLARKLLKIQQVTGVFFGRDFISVNKSEDASWAALRPIVLNAMMDSIGELEGKGEDASLVEDITPAEDTRITEEDDEVVAMIKELLETRIRPAIQEDGGDIFYMGFDRDNGIVKLKMAGSCVGCPSSTATLRNGVENMLMHYIPEVKGIEQIKDVVEKEGEKAFETLEERLASAGAS